MMSPGGKVEWLCPACYSPEIERDHTAPGLLQNDGICTSCYQYFHWATRIKLGKKQRIIKLLTGEIPNEYQQHAGKQTTS